MKILRRAKQQGQALYLGMVLMAVSASAVFVMYNTSQMATEKSRLVNAADGAAYSGAVWAARNLNFMAYTNRAMIANHVAVGHYVSYVSWIRYVEETVDGIEDIATILNAIPGIGTAIHRALNIIERGVRVVKQLSEQFAPIFINASDLLNQGLAVAQVSAHGSMATHLAFTPQAEVMRAAAVAHDQNVRVNHTGDMTQLRGLGVGLDIARETSQLNGFIERYRAGRDDRNRMRGMSRQSYGASEKFITDREWRLFVVAGSLRKNSRTTETLGRRANWSAEDSFEYKFPGSSKWHRLSRERANARSLKRSNYTGIDHYYDVQDTTPNSNTRQTFNFTAYATMPITRARLTNLMGLRTTATRMAALSRAELYFERPREGFSAFNGTRGEYANVYNPFWEARLTDPPREMLQGIL
ncbi:MAG: pilus assembly protein TadG-related protein [Gammaproteobacteria bacterium]